MEEQELTLELARKNYFQLIGILVKFSSEVLKLEKTKNSPEMAAAISELWTNVFNQMSFFLEVDF